MCTRGREGVLVQAGPSTPKIPSCLNRGEIAMARHRPVEYMRQHLRITDYLLCRDRYGPTSRAEDDGLFAGMSGPEPNSLEIRT